MVDVVVEDDSTMKNVGKYLQNNNTLTFRNEKIENSFHYFNNDNNETMKDVSRFIKRRSKNNILGQQSNRESANSSSETETPRETKTIVNERFITHNDNLPLNSIRALGQSSMYFNNIVSTKNESNSNSLPNMLIHSSNNESVKNPYIVVNELPNIKHKQSISQTSAIHSKSRDSLKSPSSINALFDISQTSAIHLNNNNAIKNFNPLPNNGEASTAFSNNSDALLISSNSNALKNISQTNANHSKYNGALKNPSSVDDLSKTLLNLGQSSRMYSNSDDSIKIASNINALPIISQTSANQSKNNDALKIETSDNTLQNALQQNADALILPNIMPILPNNNNPSKYLAKNDYLEVVSRKSSSTSLNKYSNLKTTPTSSSVPKGKINNINLNSNQNETDSSEFHQVQRSATASLLNDLLYFFKSDSDITFDLKKSNKTLKVHKFTMLARSLWFDRCYRVFVKNNNLNCFDLLKTDNYFENFSLTALDHINDKFCFQIENVSISTFKELIKYVYTSKCNFNNENIIDLLQLAFLFEVHLKGDLTTYLIENLEQFEVKKLIQIFYFSDKFKIEKLKDMCIILINKQDKTVVHTLDWMKLLEINAALVLDVFKLRYK